MQDTAYGVFVDNQRTSSGLTVDNPSVGLEEVLGIQHSTHRHAHALQVDG